MPGVFPRSRIQFPNPEILKYTNECKNQCTNFSLMHFQTQIFRNISIPINYFVFVLFLFLIFVGQILLCMYNYCELLFFRRVSIFCRHSNGSIRKFALLEILDWYFCSTIYLYFCIFKFLFNISFTQLTKLSL